MAEEPISLDISLYVSRLIACSRWVTEVKTVEMPEESMASTQFLNKVDISANLVTNQVDQLQKVLRRHKEVFGLEGRL